MWLLVEKWQWLFWLPWSCFERMLYSGTSLLVCFGLSWYAFSNSNTELFLFLSGNGERVPRVPNISYEFVKWVYGNSWLKPTKRLAYIIWRSPLFIFICLTFIEDFSDELISMFFYGCDEVLFWSQGQIAIDLCKLEYTSIITRKINQ